MGWRKVCVCVCVRVRLYLIIQHFLVCSCEGLLLVSVPLLIFGFPPPPFCSSLTSLWTAAPGMTGMQPRSFNYCALPPCGLMECPPPVHQTCPFLPAGAS